MANTASQPDLIFPYVMHCLLQVSVNVQLYNHVDYTDVRNLCLECVLVTLR